MAKISDMLQENTAEAVKNICVEAVKEAREIQKRNYGFIDRTVDKELQKTIVKAVTAAIKAGASGMVQTLQEAQNGPESAKNE